MNYNSSNILNRELTNEEKEKLKERRITALRKLGSCSFLIVIVSIISIGIGIGCIGAFASEGKVPYVVGAALISGCMTLLSATIGILAYKEGMAQEKATSDFNIDAGYSVKCKVIGSYVVGVINLTILGFSAASGIIGLVLCTNDNGACEVDSTAKMALSALTVIVAALLFIFTFTMSIWFCVYARIFGFTGRNMDGRMELQMMRMQMQLDKQQQQIQQQQQQLKQQQHTGYSNYSYN